MCFQNSRTKMNVNNLGLLSKDLSLAISKDMVTVVVPTFNEEEAIGMVLDELFEAGYKKVLVVDGYSVDGTAKVAENGGLLACVCSCSDAHIIDKYCCDSPCGC